MSEVAAITGAMKFDFSPYMQGMMQVQSLTSIFPQCVTNFIANPLLGLVGIFKDATRTIAGWVGNLAEAADSADELAASLGVNVEFLTAYGRAASLAGSSLQDVGQAFQFLNRSIAEASKGGDKADAFAKLGVSIRDAAGNMLSAEDVILPFGEAIKNLPNAAQRTQVAMELLGRGAGGMIATFMEGRTEIERLMNTARSLGAVVTAEEAKSAAAYKDKMAMMGWAWEGIKKALTTPLIEALTPVLTRWLKWFEENPEKIKEIMKGLARFIVTTIETIAAAIDMLLEHFDSFRSGVGTLGGAALGFKIAGPWGALAGGVGGFVLDKAMNWNSGASQAPVVQHNTFNQTFANDGEARKTVEEVSRKTSWALQNSEALARRGQVQSGLGGQ